MEAIAGATNIAKLEICGSEPYWPLPFGYANEFTVIFSDVHNVESGRSIESKEIQSGPFKWYVFSLCVLLAPIRNLHFSCFSLVSHPV